MAVIETGDDSDSASSSSAIPPELLRCRHRRTRFRPVFPRIDWMIIPNTLAYIMSWYGLFVGKFPVQVMSAVFGLAIVFAAGLHRIKIADLRPEDYLPTDSRSTVERSVSNAFDYNDPANPTDIPSILRFQRRKTTPKPHLETTTLISGELDYQAEFDSEWMNSSNLNRNKREAYLDPQGRYQTCRINSVLIVSKRNISDPTGKTYNLFNRAMLKEIERLEDAIYSTGAEVVSPESGDGDIFFYESEPGRDNGVCTQQPTGECGGFNLRVMKSMFPTDSMNDPISMVFSSIPGVGLTYPHYMSYDLSQFFGKVETDSNDHNGMVKHIGAIREVYCVNDYQADYFKRAYSVWEAWEKSFHATMKKFKSDYFEVYWMAEYQKQAEQDFLIRDMLPKVGITFFALMLWCTVGALMNDAVRSKPWAGIIGVFATLTGCVSGFGICLWINPRFWPIIMAVPLLTLAIGLDDMFILLEAWSHTNPALPVEERIMLSMNVGGTSIVITFFINMLDFVIGNYTPYPLIQALSTYAIATMVLDFFFQMTIFCAGLSLFGSAEEKNSHACCCCLTIPTRGELIEKTKAAASNFQLLCCAGGLPRDDAEKMRRVAEEEDDIEAGHFQDKITSALSWGLTRLPFRILAILGFFLYLGLSVWSISKMELGLKAERVYRKSSNLYDYAYYHRNLFSMYSNEILVIVNSPVDYWKPDVQLKFMRFMDKIEKAGYFWGDGESKCWIVDFIKWANDKGIDLSSINSDRQIIDYLRQYPDGFLASPNEKSLSTNSHYAKDIRISPNASVIVKSRFRLRARNMTGPERQIGMMAFIRQLVDRFQPDIPMLAYTVDFQVYDQFLTAVPATLYYCGMTLGCAFLVALFMIPHPACLFWVAVFVTSVLIGIIGQMRVWNMDLDSISLINLLIAISFCSDLIAHPVYIFLITPVPKTNKNREIIYGPEARLIKARALIEEVASAAVPACIGTTLSVIAMSNSDAYIYQAFFRIMFLSVVLSVFHSLVFVPAFLTFIGPSTSGLQMGGHRSGPKSEQSSLPTDIEDLEGVTSIMSEPSDGPIVFRTDRLKKKPRTVVVEARKPQTTHQTTQTEQKPIMGFLPHRPSAAHGGAGLRMFYGARRIWDAKTERQYHFEKQDNPLSLKENQYDNVCDDEEENYLPATIRAVPVSNTQKRVTNRNNTTRRQSGNRPVQQQQQSQIITGGQNRSFPNVLPLARILSGGMLPNNSSENTTASGSHRGNTLNRSRHGVEMLPAKHRFHI